MRAQARADADARLAALNDRLMAGESDWGTTSKYIGSGKLPKSDWEYSNQPLLDHLAALRRAAGRPEQIRATPTLQADREAWQALRARRAIRA